MPEEDPISTEQSPEPELELEPEGEPEPEKPTGYQISEEEYGLLQEAKYRKEHPEAFPVQAEPKPETEDEDFSMWAYGKTKQEIIDYFAADVTKRVSMISAMGRACLSEAKKLLPNQSPELIELVEDAVAQCSPDQLTWVVANKKYEELAANALGKAHLSGKLKSPVSKTEVPRTEPVEGVRPGREVDYSDLSSDGRKLAKALGLDGKDLDKARELGAKAGAG